ncbi:MAG: OmpA family protein [Cytophagaceae bacterium]|nr:OmpA family protein [Cytophagaceae bacterium]
MKSIFLIILSFVFFNLSAQTELAPTEQEGLVKFTVSDPKGIPEEGAIVRIESVDKKTIRKTVADIDGKGAILFPEGIPFNIIVHKFNHDFEMGSAKFEVKPGTQKLNLTLTIEVVTTYVRKYDLNHLFFEPGRSDIAGLKAGSMEDLNLVLDSLNKKPKMKIEIGGHTDNVGDDLMNLHLSQKRADAIRDYLIQKGISGERILAKGYGEKDPKDTNDTPEGRANNRRTEIKVIEE